MRAKRLRLVGLCLPGLLITACGGSGGADGPGSVTVDEAKALDEAAEMLDERRLPKGALSLDASASEQAQEGEGE
ncbi:MAG: hypothetical protein AAGI28_16945 [Pseudomonadota bacterium]